MNTFFNNKSDIIAWLQEYEIVGYTLVPNEKYGFVVDVGNEETVEGVYILNQKLSSIPVKFNKVWGYFDCAINQLTSLDFAPIQCYGFDCCNNQLTSLVGSPQNMVEEFLCSENQIVSLEGGPQTVQGDYFCDSNRLVNLKGSPRYVKGLFECSHNKIKSLKGVPPQIAGSFVGHHNPITILQHGPIEIKYCFYAYDCQLENLKYLPKKVGSNQIFLGGNAALGALQEVEDFQKLKKMVALDTKVRLEREKLDKLLVNNSRPSKSNNKI